MTDDVPRISLEELEQWAHTVPREGRTSDEWLLAIHAVREATMIVDAALKDAIEE